MSYSSYVELVDPVTGNVWAKSPPLTKDDGLITGLAVTEASSDQVTILAVEMVNDTVSNLLQVQLFSDNSTVADIVLKGTRIF